MESMDKHLHRTACEINKYAGAVFTFAILQIRKVEKTAIHERASKMYRTMSLNVPCSRP